MRAARLHAYGSPLVVGRVAEPVVEGAFDVIVRVDGAGLCRTDLHIVDGMLADAVEVELPYTLGHENAGWVEDVGAEVTNVEVGDPVLIHPRVTCGFCRACRAGSDMFCEDGTFPGLTADGGFAELLKTSARSVVKLDARVAPKDVAALADAGLAAYHAVTKAANLLSPGTRAVVVGVGGLGHVAVQCVRELTAAEIIAVDTSDPAIELALELGADHALHADGRHVDAVREITEGGADVVLDFVGEGAAIADAISMLRTGGAYYVIGYGGILDVPTAEIVARELSIVGCLVGTYNELAELATLARQGRIRLETTDYPLAAIGDALEDLRHGRLRGRAVILPSADS